MWKNVTVESLQTRRSECGSSGCLLLIQFLSPPKNFRRLKQIFSSNHFIIVGSPQRPSCLVEARWLSALCVIISIPGIGFKKYFSKAPINPKPSFSRGGCDAAEECRSKRFLGRESLLACFKKPNSA